MPERLKGAPREQELGSGNETVGLARERAPELEVPESPEVTSEQPASQVTALKRAKVDIREAFGTQELDAILANLDFSEEKYSFAASGLYNAEATTGSHPTRTAGRGGTEYGGDLVAPQYYDARGTNKWGNPRQEAHSNRQPVEKVGVQKSPDTVWVEEVKRAPGLRGVLGFKRRETVRRKVEPTYRFDYEFAAPSSSDDENAVIAGNRTGLNIRLSLKLSKEQVESLSRMLKEDSTVARTILDTFVSKTGDVDKWNAEIFENGEFHDPGKDSEGDLLARDIRPRYEAVSSLKPEVVGLLPQEESAK